MLELVVLAVLVLSIAGAWWALRRRRHQLLDRLVAESLAEQRDAAVNRAMANTLRKLL